jgi:hypothetical protein
MGWTYDDVLSLPAQVYELLVEELIREDEAAAAKRP